MLEVVSDKFLEDVIWDGVWLQVEREAQTDSRHTPWKPSLERDERDPELAAILRKVRFEGLLQ